MGTFLDPLFSLHGMPFLSERTFLPHRVITLSSSLASAAETQIYTDDGLAVRKYNSGSLWRQNVYID